MATIYVTTSIPYVNSSPHIGHALELVQADVLARYYRLIGANVQFQTGTDENALKNVLAAKTLGVSTQELVDQNAASFQSLVVQLNISSDEFIRTTEERHRNGVLAFWKRLRPTDLYLHKYRGLYCIGCEDFYLEKDLVSGCCPDHGTQPKQIEEENVFFKLSSYQKKLGHLISSGQLRIIPETRKREVLGFIGRGLQDISITRSSERSGGWGIPVPGNPSQVIYVWVDALINYLTGQGYGKDCRWKQVWNESVKKIHVIGKNVWKFHAVYWPAFLASADLPLPNELFIHGFLTENGRKISKSLGNTIDPFEYASKYTSDGLRHYLLKSVSPFEDGDFSSERIRSVYESELANSLGNLVSRVTSLCEKADFGSFSINTSPTSPAGFHEAIEGYRLNEAAQLLWDVVNELNQEIARVKPWEFLKSGLKEELRTHLNRWLTGIYTVGYWIRPFLPDAGEKVLAALTGDKIKASAPLFQRISKCVAP